MSAKAVIEHLVISLAGSLTGIALGILASRLTTSLMGSAYSRRPRLSQTLSLLPWRTAIVGIMLWLQIPVIFLLTFGLGTNYGIASVATMLCVLSLIVVPPALTGPSEKQGNRARLIPVVRSLSVFSVVLTAFYGTRGAGGLGRLYLGSVQFQRRADVLATLLAMVGIALVIDLAIGIAQYSIARRGRGPAETAVVREAA